MLASRNKDRAENFQMPGPKKFKEYAKGGKISSKAGKAYGKSVQKVIDAGEFEFKKDTEVHFLNRKTMSLDSMLVSAKSKDEARQLVKDKHGDVEILAFSHPGVLDEVMAKHPDLNETGRANLAARKAKKKFSKGGKIGALGKPFLLSKKQRVGVRMGEFGVQDAETAKLVEVDRKRAGHRKVDEVKRRVNDLHEWKLEDRRDSVYAKGGIVKSVKDVIRQLDAKGDWHNDAAIAQHSQGLKPMGQRMLKKVVEGRRKMPGQYAKGGILSQVAKLVKPKPRVDPNAGLKRIRDDLDVELARKPQPITPRDMTDYFEEHMRKRDAWKLKEGK